MFGFKNQSQVLCIGSTSVDLFFPTDEGEIIETPEDITSKRKIAFELGGKILAENHYTAIGGCAANVSQGLSRLGIKTGCYSCLGKDSNGEFCIQGLQDNKVDTEYIKVLPDVQTDLSAIIVTPSGERTIIHNRDANKRLVVEADHLTTNWVFLSSLNGQWQKNIETVLQTQKTSSKPFYLAFNPGQHNLKEDPRLILQVIRSTDLLVLNKDEALEIVLNKIPESQPESLEDEVYLLKTLQRSGAKVVAITDGARGAWVFDGKECWFLQTPKNANIVDSTGAGDAFTSGFLGAFFMKKTIDECLRFGMANSQAVISQYGGCAGLLTLPTIENVILHLIPQKLS